MIKSKKKKVVGRKKKRTKNKPVSRARVTALASTMETGTSYGGAPLRQFERPWGSGHGSPGD